MSPQQYWLDNISTSATPNYKPTLSSMVSPQQILPRKQVTLILQTSTPTLWPSYHCKQWHRLTTKQLQFCEQWLQLCSRVTLSPPKQVTPTPQGNDSNFTSMRSTWPTNVTPINQCTLTILWPHTKPTQELGWLLVLPLYLSTILMTSHWIGHSTHPMTCQQ